MKRFGSFVALALMACFVAHAEMRVWTSVKGDTLEAEFVRVLSGDRVALKRADGRELKIPIRGLCEEDKKFIKEAVPPKVEIDVKVDDESKVVGSLSGYEYDRSEKRQSIKCSVYIKQKNREASSHALVARLLVFSKDLKNDEYRVEQVETHDFSFEKSRDTTFWSSKLVLDFIRDSYSGNRGQEFEGYLVCVEDKAGRVIGVQGSRKGYEDNVDKFRSVEAGTKFDDKYNMSQMSQKERRRWERNRG